MGFSSGVIFSACQSNFFESVVQAAIFKGLNMAALASLMREHDCTECPFDIFLLKNRFLEWLALL